MAQAFAVPPESADMEGVTCVQCEPTPTSPTPSTSRSSTPRSSSNYSIDASAPCLPSQEGVRVLQQRLLLLNHASQCTEKWCRVSPHCPYMKKLWTHMLQCKDRQCKISHCISSRYVLSHYGRCVNSGCSICPPVRESVKRERGSEVISYEDRDVKRPRHQWWAKDTVLRCSQLIGFSYFSPTVQPVPSMAIPSFFPSMGVAEMPSAEVAPAPASPTPVPTTPTGPTATASPSPSPTTTPTDPTPPTASAPSPTAPTHPSTTAPAPIPVMLSLCMPIPPLDLLSSSLVNLAIAEDLGLPAEGLYGVDKGVECVGSGGSGSGCGGVGGSGGGSGGGGGNGGGGGGGNLHTAKHKHWFRMRSSSWSRKSVVAVVVAVPVVGAVGVDPQVQQEFNDTYSIQVGVGAGGEMEEGWEGQEWEEEQEDQEEQEQSTAREVEDGNLD